MKQHLRQREAAYRASCRQRYRAARDAAQPLWVDVVGAVAGIGLLASGVIEVQPVGEDEPLLIDLCEQCVGEYEVITEDIAPALVVVHGGQRIEVVRSDGGVEWYRWVKDRWLTLRDAKAVTIDRFGQAVFRFGASGITIQIGSATHQFAAGQSWQLPLGGGYVASGVADGIVSVGAENECASVDYRLMHGDWLRLTTPQPRWHFAAILNGETSVSAEVLGGLVKVYDCGTVGLWDTHTFRDSEEINETLVGDDGGVRLRVVRAEGSNTIYLYEDDAKRPTNALQYHPEYFPGRREGDDSLYPAWLYASGESATGVSDPGLSPGGTMVLALVAGLAAMSRVADWPTFVLAVAAGAVTLLGLGRRIVSWMASLPPWRAA